MIEIIKAIFYGIIEGITEWLPVSSTGHLILLDEFLKLNVAPGLGEAFAAEYMSMFEVVIQLGAILAVVILFFGRLWPFSRTKSREERATTWSLWLKVIVASVPAAFVGIVIDKLLEKLTSRDIDGWLYNSLVVAAALIVYGVLLMYLMTGNNNGQSISGLDASYTGFITGSFISLGSTPIPNYVWYSLIITASVV